MRLSVIIPTRNRAARVGDLLDSLARQQPVTFRWEVVVVDNGSADDTAAVVRRKAAELPIAIRCVHEPEPGLHQGRHRGALEARGQILGFLDDDMILAPTWIQGSDLVAGNEADAVVGRVLPKWEARPPAWLSRFASNGVSPYLGLLDLGPARKPVEPLMVFGGNCFLRRNLLFSLGGFHPDGVPPDRIAYRGDGETGLMLKFRERGLRAMYDPAATAYHVIGEDRLTVEYLCKRSFSEGVSRSFTEARARHAVKDSGVGVPTRGPRWKRVLRRIITDPRGALVLVLRVAAHAGRRVGHLAERLSPLEGHVIARRLRESFEEGRRFHARAMTDDPTLREYVCRAHYFPDDARHEVSA